MLKEENEWIDCLENLNLSDNEMSEEEDNKHFGLKKKIKKNKNNKKNKLIEKVQ